jgi:hypothetical protein
MVDVRVREDDRIETCDVERWGRPIPRSELLQTLKQAAVDQDFGRIRFEQVAGAGDGFCRPEEAEPWRSHGGYLRSRVLRSSDSARQASTVVKTPTTCPF